MLPKSIYNSRVKECTEFTVLCYINHEWQDKRLRRKNHHTVIQTGHGSLWIPDTFCLNCRDIISASKREMVRIDTEGYIYYSQRAELHASCIMNLEHFPFDVQTCKLKFSSYSLNDSYIDIDWKRGLLIEEIQLDQFIVQKFTKSSKVIVPYVLGNYTILEGQIFFERQIGYYIIQFFVPSICLVFLSWVTFYMSIHDAGNRITIGVTLILTMIFLLGYVNANLPKVSYIKSIDEFAIISLTIIMGAVLESVVIYYLIQQQNKDSENRSPTNASIIQTIKDTTDSPEKFSNVLMEPFLLQYDAKSMLRKRLAIALDNTSKFIFPLSYIGYVIYFFKVHLERLNNNVT